MIKRHLQESIQTGLEHFPVVLLTGARQVGKSTLVQALIREGWPAKYLTLDDRAVLDVALLDPDGFIDANPAPLVIDEIQRAPDLMRAIKLRIDRDRRAGMYLLTGSANVMTMSKVSETLAGRIAVFELQPFSWSEMVEQGKPDILAALFKEKTADGLIKRLESGPGKGYGGDYSSRIREMILRGAYPTPALTPSAEVRRLWFSAYRTTYVERDLRDLAIIARLPDFSRLFQVAAARTGQLMNVSDISRDVGLPYATLQRYMNLLRLTYQVYLLPPYFTNVGKRLIKTPKLYLGDTGMALHLMGIDSWQAAERLGKVGALVETWAWSELKKLISADDPSIGLYFWRTSAGHEVDFILEKSEDLVAVEVKWSKKIDRSDISRLSEFESFLSDRVKFKIILYGGNEPVGIDRSTMALPFAMFFGV